MAHNGHPVEVEEELRFAGRKIHTDDDEDDMDALIEELESLDPEAEIEEEINELGNARAVPEELLQTDTRVGLMEPEVIARRKKYGLNRMKEEKENLILKFLRYFVGPIQFVMEVRTPFSSTDRVAVRPMPILTSAIRLPQSLLSVSETGSTLESSVPCCF